MNEYDDGKGESVEHRGHPRERTKRAVEFVGTDPEQAWLQGTVVDVSTGGVQIRTRTPMGIGASLELEVYESGMLVGTPLRSKGRVVWVKALEDGQHAMGIRILVQLAPETLDDLEVVPVHESPGERGSSATGQEAIARFSPADTDSSSEEPLVIPWGRILPVIFLFFLLAALFSLINRLQFRDSPVLVTLLTEETVGQEEDEIEEDTPNSSALTGSSAVASGAGNLVVAMILDEAEVHVGSGDWEAAAAAFAQVQANRRATGGEQVLAQIGEVASLVSNGDRLGAQGRLDALEQDPSFKTSPWMPVLEKLVGLDATSLPDEIAPIVFQEQFALEAEEPESTESAPSPGRRIRINTADHSLQLLEGDRVLEIFPVGLGRGDTTPRGTFRIVNKLESPDWYNKGDVVLAGDPENPLGAFWMGLGLGQGGPNIPIGIHPTEEQESIGQNCSAGCIRMLPKDAASLFALCEVGTPVEVGP